MSVIELPVLGEFAVGLADASFLRVLHYFNDEVTLHEGTTPIDG